MTSDFSRLLDASEPRIYALNAFRQLRLPSEASTAAAKRELDKLNLAASLHSPQSQTDAPHATPPPDGSIHIFLPQDPGQAREAFRRFSTPELRLIDEFFWFWPHTPGAADEDEALQAIAHDDAPAALAIWQAQASRPGEHSIATHNLAVLHHMAALDLELLPAQGTLPNKLRSLRADHWQLSYSYWLQLLQHPAFWRRLADRVVALDDPRLPKDAASAFRTSLPLALLLINTRLAVAYGDLERFDDVRRQAALLDACGFPSEEALRAKQIATKPVQERLKAACESASEQAKKDPVRADQVARDLLDNPSFARGLATADILFQAEDESRIAFHDDLALEAFSCLVAFANKTEQWDTVATLTLKALQVAQGEQAKARIQEGLKTATENAQGDLHWRLPGYWDLPKATLDELERAHDLLEQGDETAALAICTRLHSTAKTAARTQIIGRAAAICLNARGHKTLAQAMEPFSAKPSYLITDADRYRAQAAIRQAGEDLAQALRYDPVNRDIHKGHDSLQAMARKAGVSIPPKPGGARPGVHAAGSPIAPRAPSAPTPNATHVPAQKSSSGRNWAIGIVAVVIGMVLLLCLLMIGGLGAGPSTSGSQGVSNALSAERTATVAAARTQTAARVKGTSTAAAIPRPTATTTSAPTYHGLKCLRWNEVGARHIDTEQCIYGRIYTYGPYSNQWDTIEFSASDAALRVKDWNFYYLEPLPVGDCVMVFGSVRDNGSYLMVTPDKDAQDAIRTGPASVCR